MMVHLRHLETDPVLRLPGDALFRADQVRGLVLHRHARWAGLRDRELLVGVHKGGQGSQAPVLSCSLSSHSCCSCAQTGS